MRAVHFLILLTLGGALVLAAGCTPDASSARSSSEASTPDVPAWVASVEGAHTDRMRAVLDTVVHQARQHPEDYFYLNGLAAEDLARQLQEAPARPQPSLRFAYAYRLLYAGQTEAAIDQLNRLLKDLDASPLAIDDRSEPLFELLAVAYMRLGEQQNCIDNPSAASCILPITGAGVHTRPTGSRRAIAIYNQLRRHDPQDLQSRWLLNVAHMTLGQYPEQVPDAERIEGITASPASPITPFPDVAMHLGVDHRALSGGASVDDFNGDGMLDIFATSYGLTDPVKLYLSDGEGGYADHTTDAGLDAIHGGLNVIHADYNNDGHPDLLILRGAWLGQHGQHPNSLLRNNGDGTFTDVTFEAGLGAFHPTQVAAWGDANRDGWVDLFVGNESNAEYDFLTGATAELDSMEHPSALYLNNGDGTFTDVAARVGIDLHAYVKGAAWGDANGDGWPDLYVSVLGGANRLYINHSGETTDELRFVDRAAEAGVDEPLFSFPTWFWDYDNDGDDDLFVTGYDIRYVASFPAAVAAEHLGRPHDAELPRVYRNEGDGTFTDATSDLGLNTVMFAMGANYGDLDNDGFEDFYVGTGAPDLRSLIPNRMFRNGGGHGFTEVTYEGGFGHIQKGHGVAFADLDRDGDQDIYTVIGGAVDGDVFQNALFENPGHGNHWVTLVLEGRTANRSAIGARLALSVRDSSGAARTIHRTVSTGGSFGASSLQQEIGLGTATRIDTLRITWPNTSQTEQVFTDLPADQTFRIVESQQPAALDRPPVPFRLEPPSHHHTPSTADVPPAGH